MKIDLFKIMRVINVVIALVDGLKKPGADKLATALDKADELLPEVEAAFGKDLLKNEKIRPFAVKYIDAAIALKNIVAEVKALKADPN